LRLQHERIDALQVHHPSAYIGLGRACVRPAGSGLVWACGRCERALGTRCCGSGGGTPATAGQPHAPTIRSSVQPTARCCQRWPAHICTRTRFTPPTSAPGLIRWSHRQSRWTRCLLSTWTTA
jgi:hypothetical protein